MWQLCDLVELYFRIKETMCLGVFLYMIRICGSTTSYLLYGLLYRSFSTNPYQSTLLIEWLNLLTVCWKVLCYACKFVHGCDTKVYSILISFMGFAMDLIYICFLFVEPRIWCIKLCIDCCLWFSLSLSLFYSRLWAIVKFFVASWVEFSRFSYNGCTNLLKHSYVS